MASFGNGDSFSPQANINVTPLVDVMLVLLIIFMVTAPLLQQGVEVNLPKASTAPLKGSTEQLVISVDKAGTIFLGAGNPIELGAVGKKVRAILETKKEEERMVYIKGDTSVSYGVIMQVMAELHNSGITQIGLVSAPAEEVKRK